MSTNITNEDVVLALVKKATEYPAVGGKRGVRGKKALQKSMYFFNQKIRRFSFRWGDYGPFSQEIQFIAADLVEMGSIGIERIPTGKKGAVIGHMTYKKWTTRTLKDWLCRGT